MKCSWPCIQLCFLTESPMEGNSTCTHETTREILFRKSLDNTETGMSTWTISNEWIDMSCMCDPQSPVELNALSGGLAHPLSLRQPSRGCGQLFAVLLDLPAPPWVSSQINTASLDFLWYVSQEFVLSVVQTLKLVPFPLGYFVLVLIHFPYRGRQ